MCQFQSGQQPQNWFTFVELELPFILQNFFSKILRSSPFIKPCLLFRYLHENKNRKQKWLLGQCWLDSSIYIQYIKSMKNMAMLLMLRLLWNLALNNNNSLRLNSDLTWYRISSNFTEWGLDWVEVTFIICRVHCFGITGQLKCSTLIGSSTQCRTLQKQQTAPNRHSR